MILGVDYLFDNTISEEYGTNPIRILTGDFKDVVFRYGKLQIFEENDEAVVDFSYSFLDKKDIGKSNIEQFEEVAQAILQNILEVSFADREEDIIESDPE